MGLCCCFMGILALDHPPRGESFWIRLIWSTLVLVIPSWVAFSFRFGRAQVAERRALETGSMALLWTTALIVLVLGRVSDPVGVWRGASDDVLLTLQLPAGRWLALHTVLAVLLLLWNMHATLEAARTEGARRVMRAIYSLFPLTLAGLYVLARALIYNQVSIHLSTLLLGPLFLSTLGFLLALGPRGLEGIDLPPRTRFPVSSNVLTALGLLLLGLGILATFVHRADHMGATSWYETPVIAILATAFTVWMFPGFRSELASLLLMRIGASGSSIRVAVERLDHRLAGIRSNEEILEPLRGLVQELFGPVQLQLWSLQKETGDMVPLDRAAPTLVRRHPLTAALQRRTSPLPVTGEATGLMDIPLHVSVRDMVERYGLRVFFPVTSRRELVGILGCGPGGGRTLHPEDLDLLQALADHLGGLLGRETAPSPDLLPPPASRERGEGT
jgi:hypothetical protein